MHVYEVLIGDLEILHMSFNLILNSLLIQLSSTFYMHRNGGLETPSSEVEATVLAPGKPGIFKTLSVILQCHSMALSPSIVLVFNA